MGALVYKQQVIAGGSSSSGGSIINIATEDETLFNTTITITAPSKTYTTTFDNNGKAKVEGITDVGNITISVTDGENINTSTLNIPYFGNYLVNVQLKTFVEGWLESISHSMTGYDELSDVLNDEKLLRELFTRHASVDFLVQNNTAPEIETIINNDYCAKWINLRDYALDTLYADENIKTLMDTADKYFYGEWALMPQVPKMTSNTAPYGEASASSDSENPYYAFTDNFYGSSDTYANLYTVEGYQYGYLQYKFVNEEKINYIKIRNRVGSSGRAILSFKIQASNDGTNFEDITDTIINTNTNAGDISTYNIDNKNKYLYYRFVPVSHENEPNGAQLAALQFYAWQPKGNVPVMTSNTAPYGEASGSSIESGANYYGPFSNYVSGWYNHRNNYSDQFLQYKFTNPVCIKRANYQLMTEVGNFTVQGITLTLQASNDGTNWTNLQTKISPKEDVTKIQSIDIDNTNYYLYYRLAYSSYVYKTYDNHYYCCCRMLQFYGRELKVSVPAMTSNTAPWGEVTKGSQDPVTTWGLADYKVFDKSTTTNWLSGNDLTSSWIKYSFNSPTVIKQLYYYLCHENNNSSFTTNDSFELYGVDSEGNETLLLEETISGEKWHIFDINNNEAFIAYKINGTAINFNYSGHIGYRLYEANFYTLNYSEYDWDDANPVTYLFDHGVLVNSSLAFSGTASNISSAIKLIAANDEASLAIDTTDFTLLRSAEGQYGSGTNALICGSGSSNFGSTAGNLPYNHYLDISSINGENVVGVKQTAAGTFEATELWLE